MWVNMKARFVLDGPLIRLDRIDLDTDGTKSLVRGEVDAAHFPEMTFQVQSKLQFSRMRQIFFTDDKWEASGDGDFTGTFHLFKGGHDLSGKFASAVLGVNAYRFPSTYGLLRWTPKTFDVWDAGSKAFGGDARFTFSIKRDGREDAAGGAVRRQLRERRSRDPDRLRGPPWRPVRGQCHRAQSSRVAAGTLRVAHGRGPGRGRAAAGRRADGRLACRRAGARRRPREARVGSLRAAAAGGAPADRRRRDVSLRPGPGDLRGRAVCHRAHARGLPGLDGVGRSVALRLSRVERRLAGERPAARRHHHRLRVAHRRGRVRRARRIRRHDERAVPASAGRRRLQRRAIFARGTRCGARARRTSWSRTAT